MRVNYGPTDRERQIYTDYIYGTSNNDANMREIWARMAITPKIETLVINRLEAKFPRTMLPSESDAIHTNIFSIVAASNISSQTKKDIMLLRVPKYMDDIERSPVKGLIQIFDFIKQHGLDNDLCVKATYMRIESFCKSLMVRRGNYKLTRRRLLNEK